MRYTITDEGLNKVVDTVIEKLDEKARKTGDYLVVHRIEDALKQMILYHVKKNAEKVEE